MLLIAAFVTHGANTYETVALGANVHEINVTQEPYVIPRDGKGDASTGINRALTDAQGTGHTIYLPCGTYRLITEVLPKSNTVLRGAGECTILAPDPTLPIPRPIKIDGQTQVIIRDLQLDCGDATVAGRQGVALLNSTTYTTVEGVHIRRCGQYGILLGDNTKAAPYGSGGAGIIWRNNRVDMTGVPTGKCTGTIGMEYFPKGPAAYLASPGPLIEGNVVIGATADVGIKVNNSRGARIVGNTISGVTCATSTGAIGIVAAEDTVVERNTISDTRFGIVFGGAPRSNTTGGNELRVTHLVITGNTIRQYSASGIFSSDGANDIAILGNTILDGGAGTRAINMRPQPAASGGAAFSQLEISQNLLKGATIGIDLREDTGGTLGFSRVHIAGNTVHGVTATGIAVQNAPGAIITTNTLMSCRDGISVGGTQKSHRVEISHNTILDGNPSNSVNQPGIAITGDNPRIIGNRVENTRGGSGHQKYGVTLHGTKDPILQDNHFMSMEAGEIRNPPPASMGRH